ncbi:hypothetical protein GM658_27895 [Pseudoduganella eburnea]|uniref:Uncharacterized protein n=1 Tax=Massilia eburnea TaxID=1776165 RepID=A0A6L6QSK9_9BURK|nr:hypothetical protein [Massilia eburnea]MTW14443.1 hypothetical protein [Massilia eburnea]
MRDNDENYPFKELLPHEQLNGVGVGVQFSRAQRAFPLLEMLRAAKSGG